MHSLIPDLEKLTQFYFGLERELTNIISRSDAENGSSLPDLILQNRPQLAQIERMNAHILQLSDDLKKSRGNLDDKTRVEVDKLTAEAKSSATRIHELCVQASGKIEKKKLDISCELKGIGKGKRYLKSTDPVKSNYPKFIDSIG